MVMLPPEMLFLSPPIPAAYVPPLAAMSPPLMMSVPTSTAPMADLSSSQLRISNLPGPLMVSLLPLLSSMPFGAVRQVPGPRLRTTSPLTLMRDEIFTFSYTVCTPLFNSVELLVTATSFDTENGTSFVPV